jgi:hypothetical protein
MYIVAIGWMYVVLMMSITESSIVAGVMTFLIYGVIPLSIILYLMGTGKRKRNRAAAEKSRADSAAYSEDSNSLDTEAPAAHSQTQSDAKPRI